MTMLNSDLENLWNAYLQSEKAGVRRTMLLALERFIDSLLQLPQPVWHRWAKDLAAAVADRDDKTPVRFPLFKRVLSPALVEGFLAGEAPCGRWLAAFESMLCQSPDPRLPSRFLWVINLLSEALHLDPADQLTRLRLVERQASFFNFTLHEVPAGVLCGMDGATPEEIQYLLNELRQFKENVAMLGQQERFADLIRDCEFHYPTYAAYLRSPHPDTGYPDFLSHLGKQ
jgi:hypothetical protein